MRKFTRNFKKKATAMILAGALMGCTGVMAASYSLVFAEYSQIQYSGQIWKGNKDTNVASFQQTGSTPGTYQISYSVVNASNADRTTATTVSSTDRSHHNLSYIQSYKDDQFYAKLRGVCTGMSLYSVHGEWNPNQ